MRVDNDLARAAGDGVRAMFVLMAKDRSFQACVAGQLRTGLDSLHRDKYWNAAVAAWYPKGRDDPELTMLRLACVDAQVWISDAGPAKFVWEIAKANLGGHEPNLGGSASVNWVGNQLFLNSASAFLSMALSCAFEIRPACCDCEARAFALRACALSSIG